MNDTIVWLIWIVGAYLIGGIPFGFLIGKMRGGMIQSMEDKAGGSAVHAQAPMAKMFGFTTTLRSVTQGRASFGMTFSHFQKKTN